MTIEQNTIQSSGFDPRSELPSEQAGPAGQAFFTPADRVGEKLRDVHPAGNHHDARTEVKVNVGAVLRAQKTFIKAQTNYGHTRDVSGLAVAQTSYASSLAEMLVTIDPAAAARLQEDYIGLLTRALEEQHIL
jgi:hypothetical protein